MWSYFNIFIYSRLQYVLTWVKCIFGFDFGQNDVPAKTGAARLYRHGFEHKEKTATN